MQKFINKPQNLTSESLEGLVLANSDIITLAQGSLVVNKKLADADRVTIVSLGAAGHEPAMSGFVGEGLVDIAVIGDIFAAPGPKACVDAIKLADKGHGVLLIVSNHTGDMLTANIVMKECERLGIAVSRVVAQEDIASAPREQADERRGLVGCFALCKIAGAAAAQGKSLAEVTVLTQKLADNMASLAVAASGALNPASGEELMHIEDGFMQLGVGQDGEGGEKQPLQSADATVALMLNALLKDLAVTTGEKVLVIVSGSGATTLMEQLIVFRACYGILAEKGIEIAASLVGEYLTVQDAAGVALSIARMDEEMLELWKAPCRTPYYKN